MFNVTLMSDQTAKEYKKLSPTLHAIKLDYKTSEIFDHNGVRPWPFIAHEKRWTAHFINNKEETPESK